MSCTNIYIYIYIYLSIASFLYGIPVKQLWVHKYFLEPKYGVALMISEHPPSGERELFPYYRASALMFRCCSLLIPYRLFIPIMHMYDFHSGHIDLTSSIGRRPHRFQLAIGLKLSSNIFWCHLIPIAIDSDRPDVPLPCFRFRVVCP